MPKIRVVKGDKESLLNALRECRDSGDTEGAHSDADDALLAFIGDAEIKEAYREVPKWYA